MGGVQPGPAHCPTCNSVLVFGKKFCKDCGSPTASVWLAIQKEQLAKEAAAAKQQAQAAAAAAAAAEDATIVKGGAQAKVDAAAAAAIPNGALYPLPTTEAYTYTKGPAAPAVVDLYSSNSSINSHRDLTRAPQAPAAYASPTSSAPTYEDPQSVTQSVFTRLDSASWVLQLVVSGVQLACLVLYIRWVNRDLEQVQWWRVCSENQDDTSPYYGSCHSTIFYLIASALSVLMAIFTPNPCSAAKSGNAGGKFCLSTKNPTPLLVNTAVFALNSFEALMNYDGTNIYLTSVGGVLSLALAIVYSIKICGCCPSCTAVILDVDQHSDTEPIYSVN